MYGEEDEAINQEDCWEVISAYFEEKGLVRQQLDSFDEFIMNTMQEIVDESADIELVPEQQHNPLHQQRGDESYTIKFGQIYLSKPTWVEPDQTTSAMFPNEARLRNLTYAAPLYLDVSRTTKNYDADGNEEDVTEDLPKVFLGQVPIMLRSTYCILSDSNDRELTDLGECPYDQGGYFVINGSEKVLIAQEKMTNNAVYVFKKKQPSKWSDVAEIKSSLDASRPAQAMHVRLLNHGQVKNVSGQCIHATVPYIRSEVRARARRRRRAPPPRAPAAAAARPLITAALPRCRSSSSSARSTSSPIATSSSTSSTTSPTLTSSRWCARAIPTSPPRNSGAQFRRAILRKSAALLRRNSLTPRPRPLLRCARRSRSRSRSCAATSLSTTSVSAGRRRA